MKHKADITFACGVLILWFGSAAYAVTNGVVVIWDFVDVKAPVLANLREACHIGVTIFAVLAGIYVAVDVVCKFIDAGKHDEGGGYGGVETDQAGEEWPF